MGSWSSCFINDNKECGTGVQYRSLACLDENQKAIPDIYCNTRAKQVSQACSIECGQQIMDMVWTQWSPCSKSCGAGIQTRIIRIDDSGVIAEKQVRACYNSCSVYRWNLGPWSACELIDQTRFCGKGRQQRTVICYDSNDVRVTKGT